MIQQQLTETQEVFRGGQTNDLTDLAGELFLLEPTSIHAPHLPAEVSDARDSTYRRLLGVSDLASTVVALIATATFTHTQQVYWSMFICVLFVVPLCKLMGLYERDAHVLNHTTLDEVPRLLSAALMIAVCAFIARDLSVIGDTGIGTQQLVFLSGSVAVCLAIGRVAARFVARKITPVERLLVVGSDTDTEDLRRKISMSPQIKATIVGRVPIAFSELPEGHSRVLGETADLRRVVGAYDIDRLVVIPGNRNQDEISDVVRAVKSIGVKISLLPRMFDAVGFAVESDDVGGVQLMGVRDFRMTASSMTIKRATDVVGASIALLMASPLMLSSAIAIKLDSRGPVFYRQLRIGRGGDAFEIVKFRTMRVGAHAEREQLQHMNETTGLFKLADDPRVTRVGKFLRKTSVDEIPQLLNVLRGDMSLVGPRPLIPSEDVAITGWYRRRSQITPGITGVWQLLGPVRIPLEEMVKLDYLYVANWSWWADAKILMRTVQHVLARHNI